MFFYLSHVEVSVKLSIMRSFFKLVDYSVAILINRIDILTKWWTLVHSERLEPALHCFAKN